MSLTVGETGKPHYVATGFDMSSFTELEIIYTKPDGTIVTKSQTAGEVTLGVSGGTFPGIGTVSANEYMYYTIDDPLFLNQAGDASDADPWKAYGKYTNTTPTPDDIFIGTCEAFTVLGICP